MQAVPLHLDAGSDVRSSLEQFAQERNATGFVLSVVGNLAQAAFACPGQKTPMVLSGELEIITLQGTIAPKGVHLHLSFSDPECAVWGGHLEPGTTVLRGADLLLGLLSGETPPRQGCKWLVYPNALFRGGPYACCAPWGFPFRRSVPRVMAVFHKYLLMGWPLVATTP